MSRLFESKSTGAGVYLFADDHCPPHVHARHRSYGWTARVQFSFLDNNVKVMSITPAKKVPLQRVVNRLLDDVQDRVAQCRIQWWKTRRTTCLMNQWSKLSTAGRVELLVERGSNAKQIADAEYEPSSDVTRVRFHDGDNIEMRLQP